MKEKINQYAKGIFEYRRPEVQLVPQSLDFSVAAGECYEGSFVVENAEKSMMKGMVSTDCHYMLLEQDAFHGEHNEIAFVFQAQYLSPGETVKGNIRILSDCGSLILPFSVSLHAPFYESSIGPIRDLAQFADLAKENLQEAVNVFGDERFEDVFLKQEEEFKEIYRGLSKGENKGLAMEEFLIAIHKKVPVKLSTRKLSLHYEDCKESFREQIVLHKSNWGYCEYQIHSDAEFVEVECEKVRTLDFIGNNYELPFVINTDKMRSGRNFARITISNPIQKIQVEITAQKPGWEEENIEKRICEQESVFKAWESLLAYYMGRENLGEYSINIERQACSVDKVTGGKGSYQRLFQVLRIHLGILHRREDMVSAGMEQIEEQLDELKENNPLLYCSYYFLLGLWKAEEKGSCVSKLRECQVPEKSQWLKLWYLLQLDIEYTSDKSRQKAILELLREGCHSPFLYWELCKIYNESPDLLLELDETTEQVLHWGCRKDCLDAELQFRYTYLISRKKNFSKLLLEDLCILYEKNPTDDVLTMICKMLMKDSRVSGDDLRWYALGVEKNLKITDLYEHYMYALGEQKDWELPERVLMYFTYNNHLNAEKKALLYSYVVQQKEKNKTMYDTYVDTMRSYTFQQLTEGKIYPGMEVLYEEFLTEDNLNESLAQTLPEILFAQEITCHNPEMKGVYVRHGEIHKEEYVPFVQGKAVISVFTSNVWIFLVDGNGNRYIQSVDYTTNRLMHLEHLASKCMEYAVDDARLQLYLYEKKDSVNPNEEGMVELRRRVMDIPMLSSSHARNVFYSLVRHYYQNFEGELLDYQLEHMDWKQIEPSQRKQFVEYCAVRHCYDKAMEGVMQFGYEGMDARRLLQASSQPLRASQERENVQLVKLAWYIFKDGKFDERLITYLCNYFKGTIPEMVQIWRAASGFGLDVQEFSERIIAQIVFCDEMIPEAYEIFYEYYERGFNKKLIRAFLKMIAYKYLVKGWEIPEEMFDYFYREVRIEENRPCLLAALRRLSKKEELSGEEMVFVDYNIHQLYEKNIVMEFFQRFRGKVSLPDRIMKEQYVEYIADPQSEVKIHYQLSSDASGEEYITERMKNTFEGIRVKNFVLFQDEEVKYCISEVTPDGERKITEKRYLHFEEKTSKEEGTNWYQMLNQILQAKEKKEQEELLDKMHDYVERQETLKQLIRPLRK